MSTVSYADEVREYRLDNGLLVLLKENHNAPVVNLNVVYRVGSKYERPGITGISHLLEHLMFKTTENFPLGEFDRRLKAVGADNNAYTWLDQTVYYETIAAHEVEIALELEADRMRNLSCLPEDHEFEMQVVRNELEQREDNPTGRLYEELLANSFKAHPYGIPTIGWVDDVEGIRTAQIKEYYDTWYHPDNAFIVAVGDFDADEMFARIQHHFGSIPAAGVEHPRLPQEPQQLGERRFKLRLAGQLDYLMAGWHVPQSEHPDAYPLVVLGNILGSGRTSRLYRALVDSGMAAGAQAESSAFGYQDPFLFMAFLVANPGADTAELEQVLYAEIERIKTDGVTEAELARAKKQARVAFVFEKDSIESEARSLVDFELMSSWRDVDGYLPGIEAVSNEDIMRVASQYLVDDNRTVGVLEAIRPEAPMLGGPGADELAPPAFRPEVLAPHYRTQFAPELSLQGAGGHGASVVTLDNGITLVLRESRANATVSLSGVLPAGSINDPQDRRGLGNLVVSMLSSGTASHSKAELAEIMEDSGISLGFGSARESFSFSGRSLTEDFGLLLDMLAEQLREPSFPAEELELTRQQVLTAIYASENDTFDEAFAAGRALLYGADHPFSGRIEGRSADVEAASVADLQAWYQANVGPGGMVLSIVGDIDAAEAEAMVRERFGDWTNSAGSPRSELIARSAEFQAVPEGRSDLEMADKSNVSLLWIGPGCSKANADWPARLVANFIMGGDFSSRLNNRLRLKDGLTYGAYSFFSNGVAAGPWAAMVQVNPANVDAAINATTEELQRISSEGISEDELALAKSYLTGNFPVRLSTNGAVAGMLTDSVYLGKGVDYISAYEELINAVSLEEVNAAAAEFMDPAGLALVVCGSLSGSEETE